LRPQNAQARLALAKLKDQNGKPGEAEEMLKALNADFPRSAVAAFEMGLFYQRREKLEPALEAYKRAVQNDPSYADAHLNLGWLYRGLDKGGDALRELQEVLRLQPDHKQAPIILAAIDEIEHPKPKKKPAPKKDGGAPTVEPPGGGDDAQKTSAGGS